MTTEETYDPYELDESSGLPDNFEAEIASVKFCYDTGYADGTQLVGKFVLLTDDEDVKDRDGTVGQTTQLFSTGKGWETTNAKGTEIVREDPKKKPQFNKTSGMGLLLSAALEAGAGSVMRDRGTPMQAHTWEGLIFVWQRKEHDYGGDIGKKSKLMPVEFIGVRGDDGKVVKGGGAKSESAKADKAARSSSGGGRLPAKLRAQLVTLAADYVDHEAFVEAAMKLDDVQGNDAAEAAVLSTGDGSIWAEAHE